MFLLLLFFQRSGNAFATHTFEILFMLLVAGFIGLWLGWLLWSRYRQKAEQLQVENGSLSATVQALRQEMEDLKARYATLESDRSTLETRVQSLSLENDNLRGTLVALERYTEGLKAQSRHMAAELGMSLPPDTAEEDVPLEVAPSEAVASATEEGEPDSGNASTGAQADMAQTAPSFGSERGLPLDAAPTPEQEDPALQPSDVRSSRGEAQPSPTPPPSASTPSIEGVRFIEPVPRGTIIPIDALPDPPQLPEMPPSTEPAPDEVAEEPEAPHILAVGGPHDDLKVIEGIGPKIEQLLFAKGITTYGQLAATSVQQLKDLLVEAGPRYAMHDPGTWSAQALLAANGEWENLKAYQEFLHGGKRPDKDKG